MDKSEPYARVFPLPVTASTTTSEFFMNMGIAACCTGVVFTKPIASTASRIHSESAGVKAPNDLSTFVWGAISEIEIREVSLCAWVQSELLLSSDKKVKLGRSGGASAARRSWGKVQPVCTWFEHYQIDARNIGTSAPKASMYFQGRTVTLCIRNKYIESLYQALEGCEWRVFTCRLISSAAMIRAYTRQDYGPAKFPGIVARLHWRHWCRNISFPTTLSSWLLSPT